MRRLMAAGIITTTAAFNVIAQANEGFPEPGSVTIGSFQTNGTGCPAGSVAANLSPDNRALTLLFDQYVVDSTETESNIIQKSCVINMTLDAPAGWRYALFAIDYRGFADLEAGALGRQNTEYAFGISGQKRIGQMELRGPTSQDYQQRYVAQLSELAWSDCGNGGGPDVLTITSTAQINVQPPPAEKEIYLASSNARYAETDVGEKITAMQVVRKDSASPCSLNRTFGFQGSKAWVKLGCRAQFKVTVEQLQSPVRPRGFMTVDSIDAQLHSGAGHEYGVAWQRCGEGKWVQNNSLKTCEQVCKGAGLKLGRDDFGAECTSGESRPSSAAGWIQYTQGCWGAAGCTAQGNIKTDAVGPFCYQPGQKRDADRTDRAVGCYCKQ